MPSSRARTCCRTTTPRPPVSTRSIMDAIGGPSALRATARAARCGCIDSVVHVRTSGGHSAPRRLSALRGGRSPWLPGLDWLCIAVPRLPARARSRTAARGARRRPASTSHTQSERLHVDRREPHAVPLRVLDERRRVVEPHRLVVEQRRVERRRVVRLQVRARVDEQREAGGVRLGEAVERKRRDRRGRSSSAASPVMPLARHPVAQLPLDLPSSASRTA